MNPFHFLFKERKKILISSMGRSGSTWLSDLVNFDGRFKEVFEPFFPAKVNEADLFGYYSFLDPRDQNEILVNRARKIVNGKLRNSWTDSGNKSGNGAGILVKDIRTNLMLSWLKFNFPHLKIILLIRDPFEVAQSWMRLGWSKIPFDDRTDMDVILSQTKLLTSFPELATWCEEFKNRSPFESVILEWCILNYVPIEQLRLQPDLFLLVNYNEVLREPIPQLRKIFDFIEVEFDMGVIKKAGIKSRTTFKKVSSGFELSEIEVINSLRIIKRFNLDKYSVNRNAS